MRLTNAADWLEIVEASHEETSGSQADDDILLDVAVSIRGFSAADQAWVMRGEWDAFLQDLRRLESERQGEAILRGASPDELSIRFHVFDRAGHTAVGGRIARPHYPDAALEDLSLSFALVFDAGLLRSTLDEFSTFGRK